MSERARLILVIWVAGFVAGFGVCMMLGGLH